MQFKDFANAVDKQLSKMEKVSNHLFRVDLSTDELWDMYLNSFPEGTNEIHVERREYDCNSCKQFIRNIGGVVALDKDNKFITVWDVKVPGYYQIVTDKMAELIRNRVIKNVYLQRSDVQVGLKSNVADGVTYNHFFHNLSEQYKMRPVDIPTKLGEFRTAYEMLKKSVDVLSISAFDTVIELIESNVLYRGAEFKSTVSEFRKLMVKANEVDVDVIDNWIWKTSSSNHGICRFYNTVIGTLVMNISEGMDLEEAVGKYESYTAPANYKRTSAIITPKMIDKAQKTIDELGLTDALERRYANETDININDIIFSNSLNKKSLNVFDDLRKAAPIASKDVKAKEITLDELLNVVLPKANSVSALFESNKQNNLMSIIAPVNADAGNLFKWDNNFSWTYNGDLADSITERVKKAGGVVDAPVRVSLSWNNYDDLDLALVEPNGTRIYFGNRSSYNGGKLDVDENAGSGRTREPVENIYYSDVSKMLDGDYKVYVNNYCKRETIDNGFELQVVINDVKEVINYPRSVGNKETIEAVVITKKGNDFSIKSKLDSTLKLGSKEVWGINTNTYVPVKMIMKSPNHWNGQQIGNEHIFFILEDCKNPETSRGFYNEYLRSDLNDIRKVFEILGSKMRTSESDNQLSGIGISTTKKESITLNVDGKVYTVKF